MSGIELEKAPLGATVDQPVRLCGFKFVVALPEGAGNVCGLARYRGKLLITTDRGHLYEWNGESEILRQLPASFRYYVAAATRTEPAHSPYSSEDGLM